MVKHLNLLNLLPRGYSKGVRPGVFETCMTWMIPRPDFWTVARPCTPGRLEFFGGRIQTSKIAVDAYVDNRNSQNILSDARFWKMFRDVPCVSCTFRSKCQPFKSSADCRPPMKIAAMMKRWDGRVGLVLAPTMMKHRETAWICWR